MSTSETVMRWGVRTLLASLWVVHAGCGLLSTDEPPSARVTGVSLVPPNPSVRGPLRCVARGPGSAPGAGRTVTWTRNGEVVATGPQVLWPKKVPRAPGDVVGCQVGRAAASGARMAATGIVRRAPGQSSPGNILMIVADDLGVDKVGAYGAPTERPRTPNVDALAERGVLFERAYANAVCSPTRATLLTGRYASRTGVGTGVAVNARVHDLVLPELTLAEVLSGAPRPYESVMLGKWHLASRRSELLEHPLQQGFAHALGTVSNLADGFASDREAQGYFGWERVVDGKTSWATGYITTRTIDDALRLMETLPEPWFIYLALHAPHAPLHRPPEPLRRRSLPEGASKVERYDAMVEAMDVELGRMFRSMDASLRDRTHLMFIGDNGTPDHGTRAPFDPTRAKGTMFEGGVHVPLIIAGPAVSQPGSRTSALVNATDLFATVAELSGTNLPLVRDNGQRVVLDSVSLVPILQEPTRSSLREYAYVEQFSPNGCAGEACTLFQQALIGPRYKMIRSASGHEAFFDLEGRWIEGPRLMETESPSEEATQMRRRMSDVLDRWTEDLALDHVF